jgi:hypothetical protein
MKGLHQWQVKWIVTPGAEILGCCIVADKLGAVVPRVFAPDGVEAYAALADLLCGDTVSPELATGAEESLVSAPVCLLDRQRVEKIRQGRQDALKDVWYYEKWPENVRLHRDREGYRLGGEVFSERGQTYVATVFFDTFEQQRMLREEPVFRTLRVGAEQIGQAATDVGIPALGNRWHGAVERMFTARKAEVDAVMRTPEGVAMLMQAVTSSIGTPELDALVERALNDDLPLRHDGDTKDDDDLVRERRHAVDHVERLGQDVMASLPGLQGYPAFALGYMALAAGGEYPGSRYQSMVDAPASTDWVAQSQLLASMLVYDRPVSKVRGTALSCAIAPVLGVVDVQWSRQDVGRWYQSGSTVERHLESAGAQLSGVADWRQLEAEGELLRAQGGFLRVGEAIPATKPQSFAETVTNFRKRNNARFWSAKPETQDPASFSKAGR